MAQAQAKSEASSKAADQSLETELGKLKKESEEVRMPQIASVSGFRRHFRLLSHAVSRLFPMLMLGNVWKKEESRAHLERIGALEQQILKLEQSEKEAPMDFRVLILVT